MNYIIYMDVFLAVNTGMDVILLWLLGKIRAYTITTIRLFIGSLIGGLGSCFVIYFRNMPVLISFLLQNLLLVYGMLKIAYPNHTTRDYLNNLIIFYCLGIILNGAVTTILNQQIPFLQNTMTVRAVAVFSLGIICSCLILFFWKKGRALQKREQNLYNIILKKQGICCEGKALLDTGNQLKEPITGKPVVVAEYNAVKSLFPEDLQEGIISFGKGKMDKVYPIKWIPYHSLGNRCGAMPGIYVDEMIIHVNNENRIKKRVLIGIVFEPVSTQKLYQFILHEEYITE